MPLAHVAHWLRQRFGFAMIGAGALVVAAAASAQPLLLYGVDGDDDTMVRLDVNAQPPVIEFLGTVVHNGNDVPEMEAMAWDEALGRLIVVSNAGSGPLYRINPNDITAPPPADIPTTLVGNTNSIQMEGIAVHPATGDYYGVDNTTNPGRLVRVNRFTAQVTVIGQLEDIDDDNYHNMEGLAFSLAPPHLLYGANNPGEGLGTLVTINITNGLVTPVGPIGFVNVECLVFGPTNILYGFSNGNALVDQFITIDTATGAGTHFNTLDPEGLDIEGCAFLEAPVNVGVQPTTWSNIKARYREP